MTGITQGDLLSAIPTAMAFVAALPYAFLGGDTKKHVYVLGPFLLALLSFVVAFVAVPFSVGVSFWMTVGAMVGSLLVLSWSLVAEEVARRAGRRRPTKA